MSLSTNRRHKIVIMCPLTFTSHRWRDVSQMPTLLTVDHPPALMHSEPSWSLPPLLNAQDISLPQGATRPVPLSIGTPAQHGPPLAIGVEETRHILDDQLPELSAIRYGPSSGGLLASDHRLIQSDPPAQNNPPAEGLPVANDPNVHPESWYCHLCHNGPQSIALHASCLWPTLNGVCGHVKCHLCRTE